MLTVDGWSGNGSTFKLHIMSGNICVIFLYWLIRPISMQALSPIEIDHNNKFRMMSDKVTHFCDLCSLRLLLHKSGSDSLEVNVSSPSISDDEDATKSLVRKVIQEGIEKIKEEPSVSERSIRWELGSCWMQHLQKQETSTDNSSKNKEDGNDVEQAVKGLGKQFKFLKKREKKSNNVDGADSIEQNDSRPGDVNDNADKVEPNSDDLSNSNELEKLLSKETFLRLKESGTGLHTKVCDVF